MTSGYNVPLYPGYPNTYDLGGILSSLGKAIKAIPDDALSDIGSAVGGAVGGAVSNGYSSGAGSIMNGLGDIASMIPGPWGAVSSAGLKVVGGLTNAAFGTKVDEKKLKAANEQAAALQNFSSNATSFDDVKGVTATSGVGQVYKGGWFNKGKARRKNEELNRQRREALSFANRSVENNIDNIADTQMDNLAANFAAYGGPLGIWEGYGSGVIGYELAKENLGIKALNAANKGRLTSLPSSFESPELNTFAEGGKIHIKPSKRGTFTAAAKRNGKSVQSFASQVLANKENYSPAMVKKANFARNAANWHSFGGDLNTHGSDFTSGQIIVGNGGTHEENPMEGVPMGMDAEGNPNLVEQGEVIFNDYVFSNRLFADGGLLESLNLPKSYDGHSFAAIAEKLGDEAKERPNDPISKRGLLSSMSKLQQAQETVRQQTQEGQEGVQYAHGGRMGTLFDGFGDDPNILFPTSAEDWAKLMETKTPKYGVDWDPTGKVSTIVGESPKGMTTFNTVPTSYWGALGKGNKKANTYISNKSDSSSSKSDDDNRGSSGLDWLRYAPVVGAAIGLGQNLFSRPDYTSADTILEAANQAGNYTPIGYTPIGNYLQYSPFDRNFYLNKLNAQAGATRRTIMNTTSPSRNAALLAADYNAQGRLGDLARQAEEYNLAQRQAVETFNRGTNQANAEMGLKAAMANQEAALRAGSSRLSGVAQAMAVRDSVDARRGASMSANLTNFFNSLGDIGREEVMKAWINENPALYYEISTGGAGTPYKGKKKEGKKAKGGYLTIKPKRK